MHIGSVDDRSARVGHVEGIDTIRALAALSVVLAHIMGPELPGILKQTPLATTIIPDLAQYIFTGHPAVIAFFVVSGFCIHYPYTQKPLPILPFWIARLARIMIPALVALAFAQLVNLHDYNFWDGYILWSIVCEIFYYMFYPLFLWASRWITWRQQSYLAMILSFSLVGALGTNQYGSSHIYGPMLNWLVALPSWLIGCVLADNIRKTQFTAHANSKNRIILWRILVAFVASLLYWSTMNTPFGYYITMNIFSILVYFWIKAELNSQRARNYLLEWAGQWSYSVYLMHMPLLVIFSQILGPAWGVGPMIACLPVVIYGSYLFFRRIELPAHVYARRIFKSVDPRGLYVNAQARSTSAA